MTLAVLGMGKGNSGALVVARMKSFLNAVDDLSGNAFIHHGLVRADVQQHKHLEDNRRRIPYLSLSVDSVNCRTLSSCKRTTTKQDTCEGFSFLHGCPAAAAHATSSFGLYSPPVLPSHPCPPK
ncbi:hypothetical protein EYF80_007528 [Liparis tanakae]|uniref:Uncharacterized protein n=1 Tax=Liparis tanakae TaxID=230148 RepID=A0A4Z2IW30_9TELE|nr:hypothetical protein EYF80_007528 [Liparis tanakae]